MMIEHLPTRERSGKMFDQQVEKRLCLDAVVTAANVQIPMVYPTYDRDTKHWLHKIYLIKYKDAQRRIIADLTNELIGYQAKAKLWKLLDNCSVALERKGEVNKIHKKKK